MLLAQKVRRFRVLVVESIIELSIGLGKDEWTLYRRNIIHSLNDVLLNTQNNNNGNIKVLEKLFFIS